MRIQNVLAATITLVIASCDLFDGPADPEQLVLTLTGFDPLRNGFHYEAWAIIDGSPVSTGKFNVSTTGQIVALDGAPIAGGRFDTGVDLSESAAIVVTIEPSGDADAVPAQTKIVAGAVSGTTASLTVGAGEALGDLFTGAAGQFILATPTDGAGTDETSGVWFLDPSSGTPAPSLTLPTLPAGWKFEGWAMIGERPVTTGTFTMVSGADEAAPFSGALPGPPFPGEDFLRNAPSGLTFPTSLAGQMVVITVEPSPDDTPDPFTLKPLRGSIPANAASGVLFTLDNATASFPTGTALIR